MKMKDDLLNNGLEHTENKHLSISDLKTSAIVLLVVLLTISTCITGYFIDKSDKMEYRFKQCSEIEAINKATINELTHDNMNLINNTK